MAEPTYVSGRSSMGEPCVFRNGVYLDLNTADRLVSLHAVWAPELAAQLERAISEADKMELVF